MWVVCIECSVGFEAEATVVKKRLASGEIQAETIDHIYGPQVRHLGKCDKCRGEKVEAAEVLPYLRGGAGEEAADIQRRLRGLEKLHPEWTREECSRQAVEDHNAPSLETNASFRAYLLERGKAVDNGVPEWLDWLNAAVDESSQIR